MRDRERGRDIGRGRSRLHAGSQMQNLILVSWDAGVGVKSRIRLPTGSLLLPLRMSLPLSLSLMNKQIKP